MSLAIRESLLGQLPDSLVGVELRLCVAQTPAALRMSGLHALDLAAPAPDQSEPWDPNARPQDSPEARSAKREAPSRSRRQAVGTWRRIDRKNIKRDSCPKRFADTPQPLVVSTGQDERAAADFG